jgi:AbrB family looped-hinge helix DNA binding protein
MDKKPIIDVSHVSARGTSYRITIPKKVASRLDLNDGDILAFYDDDGVKLGKLQ